MIQDINPEMLDRLLAKFASNANGDGASLVGIEDASSSFVSSDVEGALQEIGAGSVGGGTMLMDEVAHTYTGSSTGSVVLTHDLNSTPQFAIVFMDENDNSSGASWSYGFWQNNAAGVYQGAHHHIGGPNCKVIDGFMGVLARDAWYPAASYVRVSITAFTPNDITVLRQKNSTNYDAQPISFRMALFS